MVAGQGPRPGSVTWTARRASLAGAQSATSVVGGCSAEGPAAPDQAPVPVSATPSAPVASPGRVASAARVASLAAVGRRRGRRHLSVPLGRSAVVVLTAGMLLGGGPATADGARYGGGGGRILPTAAERAVSAQGLRLAAQAQGAAAASREESLAVAAAAVDAGVVAQRLGATLGPGRMPAGLESATERLSTLLADAGAPRSSVPPWRATGAASRAATAPLSTSESLPAGDGGTGVSDELRLSAEIAGSAGEVFRLSMEVESLVRAASQAEALDRAAGLGSLELAVTSAEAAASELAALEPLTPLPQDDLPSVDTTAAGTVVATVGGRARVRTDAPAGVAALVRGYGNGQIPAEALCGVSFARGALFQCDAADALEVLNLAYRAEFGVDLQVVSSYRTLQAQVTLKAAKGFLAATPGTSNHGWGLAVDLGNIGGLGQFDSAQYRWLEEHAEAYGWHHPRGMEPGGSGPQEPWHWEFATA